MNILSFSEEITESRGSAIVESPGLHGIEFPLNDDQGAKADGVYTAIEFPDPHLDGLPAYGPSDVGVTVIMEKYLYQQTADADSSRYYYAQFWWAGEAFQNGQYEYWGIHPYPQGFGTESDHYWELAGIQEGSDNTETRSGGTNVPTYNQWYLQAITVNRTSGTDRTGTFYIDLPSVADSNVIDADDSSANGNITPDDPIIVIGDSPWYQSYQHETFAGILGRIKIIAVAMSESDILSESANMSNLVTSAAQNNIWWGKNNFTSIDDLTCDYGTGRSFAWSNASYKGTLVPISP